MRCQGKEQPTYSEKTQETEEMVDYCLKEPSYPSQNLGF